MITFASLSFIYTCAIFFWLRYFYKHSLKTPADREYLFESLKKLLLYVPIGLQAILLFCFALIHTIPLSNKLSDFIEFKFFRNEQIVQPDFESLKITFIGSLLLALQYVLLKKNYSSYKILNLVARFSIFISSIFFLRLLIGNISHSLSFSPRSELPLSYNNYYVWRLCVIGALIFTIVKGAWIIQKQMNSVKYFALASRILACYLSLIVIIAIPRIIFTIIQNI